MTHVGVIDPSQPAGSDAWNLALRQRIPAFASSPSGDVARLARSNTTSMHRDRKAGCLGSITNGG